MATATSPTIPAARARSLTPEERFARSHELAERDHLLYRSHYAGINDAGDTVFSVPSRSQRGRHHIVCRAPDGHWSCSCEAAQYGLPCGHLGAAIFHFRQIERAMTAAAAEANRRYQEFGAFLETCGW